MKKMNKLLALVLAMVMVLGLATVASAATVTVNGELIENHSFKAYQIFAGTETNTDNQLVDITWGSGINSTAFLTALQAETSDAFMHTVTGENGAETSENIFKNCVEAVDVAEVLGKNNGSAALANAVAKIALDNKNGTGTPLSTGTTELPSGYYLIVDETQFGEGAENTVYNAALLQVTGNVSITQKTDRPSVEKKVLEDDKYNQDGGYGTGYNDVADYNMGDAVPFHLIGSVPDMSRYDTYNYIFHDTLSAGLTPPADSDVKVYLSADKTLDTNDTEVTSSFETTVSNQTITVSCNDLKTIVGETGAKYVIVAYTATLNQNAEVGLDGNPNVVYLEYSNKPDQSGSGDTDNTGKTPEDKVIVFTYELDTTKVDGADKTNLKDAEFVLSRGTGEDKEYAKLDNASKVTGWTKNQSEATVLKSGDDGLFKVIGLDHGTYYLKETKAPEGYNLLKEEITVVITATTTNGQDWTNGQASSALTNLAVTADGTAGTGDTSTGIAGITVANNKGSTLPETGGIGTTIFYVLGGMLVVCAVVLMVSKKRMSAEG